MSKMDVDAVKEAIQKLQFEIGERMADLHGEVLNIRNYAKQTEQRVVERAHAEVEPLRRQMEAMIQSLATYESLKGSAPIIVPAKAE